MKTIVTDQKDVFAAYVARKVDQKASWGSFYALGIVDTDKRAVIAGVVINNFNGANATVHIAVEPGVGRALLKMLEAVADYAFNQCRLKRLTGLVPASKPDVLKFDLNVGWEEEFVMKSAAHDGGDLHVLVMWPSNCKWLRRNDAEAV
jgi:hypothetical protein